ncbi:MAG: HAD-IA family hydrolase [Planctomycetes bacterium]|nr:HAD-IA family hydrolase [Planctomycetota bacterium]
MKKPFKAIFLDRDGTLSRNSPRKESDRSRAIGLIRGKKGFSLTHEAGMGVFWRVMELPGIKPVNTLAREHAFWRKWYQLVLEDHGVREHSDALAAKLYEQYGFHKMMELFPETVGVLKALKSHGYRLGVISDTFPSLEESLKAMGIASYFQSFTASSLVGAGKPHPKIFRAATRSLDVTPQESVFVDDCKEEADGAREQGFTSFHLVRTRAKPDFGHWTLGNLTHLLEYLHIPVPKDPK